MGKSYRSEEARKLAEKRTAAERKKQEAKSKKFANGSNPHHGSSLGQSGQPKRGNR